MRERTFGTTGVRFPQVTVGTMRLAEIEDLTPAKYLCELHDLGLTAHHSSAEYASHGIYLDALSQAKRTGRRFSHIVKIAEPHFDSSLFNGPRFVTRVHEELASLRCDTIDNLQWLVRTPSVADDEGRISLLHDQRDEIAVTLNDLRLAGTVRSVSCFPYSAAFARKAIEMKSVDGLCTYLNLLEIDIPPSVANGAGYLAIRPLAAGKLNPAASCDDQMHDVLSALGLEPADLIGTALGFPLLHPNVASVIMSFRSIAQAERALATMAEAEADLLAFDRAHALLFDELSGTVK